MLTFSGDHEQHLMDGATTCPELFRLQLRMMLGRLFTLAANLEILFSTGA
jgi:hypothetical protein